MAKTPALVPDDIQEEPVEDPSPDPENDGSGVDRRTAQERKADDEADREHLEEMLQREYNKDPGRWTHIRVFHLDHQSARRGRQLGRLEPANALRDLDSALSSEWGGPAWYDLSLWSDHTSKFGKGGRMETSAPAKPKEAVGGVEGISPAMLQLLQGSGADNISSHIMKETLAHAHNKERTREQELRDARVQSFDAAKQMYDRETLTTVVGDVFSGLQGLMEVGLKFAANRRDSVAPKKKPPRKVEAKTDDKAAPEPEPEHDPHETTRTVANILVDAVTMKWEPPVLLSVLVAIFGGEEVDRMFSEMPTMIKACMEVDDRLGPALKDEEAQQWVEAFIAHIRGLAEEQSEASE